MTEEPRPSSESKAVVLAKEGTGKGIALERLSKAQTDGEVVLWTQVCGELERQSNEAKQLEHAHWKEKAEIRERHIVGRTALLVGVGLVVGGLSAPALVVPGMFALGVGFYHAAPTFVSGYFDRKKNKEKGE